MHGKGVFNWPDGKKYDGEYLQDKKHGYGIFSWYIISFLICRPDGKIYKGMWANG